MSLELVQRTKSAVRRWAGFSPNDPLSLDDALNDICSGCDRDRLCDELNAEFDGSPGFPIEPIDCHELQSSWKTVGDVEEEVERRAS